MATIDKAALIEAVAKAVFDVRDDEFDLDEWEDCRDPERWKCNAEAVVPVVVAAVLQPLRANAAMSATACHARGDSDGRRRWLDLSALMDQIEADAKGDE